MSEISAGAFQEFITDRYRKYLTDLSIATKSPLVILDEDERVVFSSGISGSVLGRKSGISSTRIEANGEPIGALVLGDGGEAMLPLVNSLANEIGKRFVLEADLYQMTDELSHAYDQLNLYSRFARELKPDECFSDNAGKLLDLTADLLFGRFLVQYLPRRDCFAWARRPSNFMPANLQWLTENPEALKDLLAEVQKSTAAADPAASLRTWGSIKTPEGEADYVGIPVSIRGEVVGYAGVFRGHEEPDIETRETRVMETLAEELSNSATTRELHLELRQLIFNVVRTLVNAIEAKDNYTRGHSERVFILSTRLGERLGLPVEELRSLSWSALLHDVGKIAIEDGILNKPGKLTDEEYEIIKTHPEEGVRMLEPIAQLRHVLPGVHHHHERFDGGGYPDGLAGFDIPLMGRIIAVADTFDALTSARSYRDARSTEFALDIIGKVAGTQLDPKIVAVLFELAGEGEVGAPECGGVEAVPV